MSIIGFDYGTSNCAVGVMQNGKPEILTLGGHGQFLPSTMYAPSRDAIAPWLYEKLDGEQKKQFAHERKLALQKGNNALRELRLDGIPTDLSFGETALENYLEEPEEGYYIKSPKSFLGASGLMPQQIQLFEDIVAAMMSNIKSLAEQSLQQDITKAVIGRPINFQGLKGEESNRQAIEVLTHAAKRVGFADVEFQYEPVAAGFEYEASLSQETRVLVVDIGGGTTDCSMLLMGPQYKELINRDAQLLAHSGVRVGGNDFDIQLALKGIMPSLGLNDFLKTGKPIPHQCFSQAVQINNVNEQTEFYSSSNRRYLEQIQRDTQNPEVFSRLIKVHDNKLSYRLVNGAEKAKIALTDQASSGVQLHDLAENLSTTLSRDLMLSANEVQLSKVSQLMHDAVVQAAAKPDVIFVTGGTAKSPVLSEFLKKQMPGIPLIVGDHFGSVTVGLTRWADRIFS